MTRLLVAISALSLLTASIASAQPYPPCRHPGDDHCRVVAGQSWGHHHRRMARGHRHRHMAYHHHHRGHHHHHR